MQAKYTQRCVVPVFVCAQLFVPSLYPDNQVFHFRMVELKIDIILEVKSLFSRCGPCLVEATFY